MGHSDSDDYDRYRKHASIANDLRRKLARDAKYDERRKADRERAHQQFKHAADNSSNRKKYRDDSHLCDNKVSDLDAAKHRADDYKRSDDMCKSYRCRDDQDKNSRAVCHDDKAICKYNDKKDHRRRRYKERRVFEKCWEEDCDRKEDREALLKDKSHRAKKHNESKDHKREADAKTRDRVLKEKKGKAVKREHDKCNHRKGRCAAGHAERRHCDRAKHGKSSWDHNSCEACRRGSCNIHGTTQFARCATDDYNRNKRACKKHRRYGCKERECCDDFGFDSWSSGSRSGGCCRKHKRYGCRDRDCGGDFSFGDSSCAGKDSSFGFDYGFKSGSSADFDWSR